MLKIRHRTRAGLFEPAEVLSSRLLVAYGEEMATGASRRAFLEASVGASRIAGIVELIAEGDTSGEASAFTAIVVCDFR